MDNIWLAVIQILQIIILPLFLTKLAHKDKITEAQFENTLDIAMQRRAIYSEIQIRRIEQCDATRIKFFQEFYQHYFAVLNHCATRTNDSKIDSWKTTQIELFTQNQNLRERAFVEQIFLGGDFTSTLIKLQIGLNDAIYDGKMSSNQFFQPSKLIEEAQIKIQEQLKYPKTIEEMFSSEDNLQLREIYTKSIQNTKNKLK